MKDARLGDRMPDTRDPKWGSMKAGRSHLSEEWHDMEHSDAKMSEKWDDQHPSKARMSEKWDCMEEEASPFSNEWHEMKQEVRMDPYSMAPSDGKLPEAPPKKQRTNSLKNEGHGIYEIRGPEGQSGRGL